MRTLRCALALLVATSALSAQTPAGGSYPNVDRMLSLSAGDSVRLLSRIVHEGGMSRVQGRRLDFTYATWIPASDAAERRAQADRAAAYLGPQAVEIGARRLSIGICDTKECAQRKHPPAQWFLYERTADGWRRTPD